MDHLADMEVNARGQLHEINEEIAAYHALQQNPFFKKFLAESKELADTLQHNHIHTQPNGMDGLVNLEYLRGQIAGINLALAGVVDVEETLQEQADVLKQQITAIEKEQEDEQGT